MERSRFISAVLLLLGTVALLIGLSFPATPPDLPVEVPTPQTPDGGPAQAPGQARYRYAARSPVWQVLARARELPEPGADSDTVTARELRFTPSLQRERYSEAVLAMAISATQGRTVRRDEVHRWFCDHEGDPCRVADYLQGATATFRIVRPEASVAGGSRLAAIEACRGSAVDFLTAWRQRLRAGHGIVVVGFVPDGFPDFAEDTSVHLFAVEAIDGAGSLFLKDGADVDPVTYRLDRSKLCEFLVAPAEFRLDAPTPPLASAWAVRPIFVERHGPPAPPDQEPAPALPSEDDGLVVAFEGPLPLDIGWFRVPQQEPLLHSIVGHGLPIQPSEFKLRTGVSRDAAQSLGAWLEQLERRRNVRGDEGQYWYDSAGDPLCEAYRHPDAGEVTQIRRLVRRFLAAGERFGRPWTLWAIVRFVQEIPYQTIHEDPMGLRSPSRVLARHGGDCDSKSLLAAVMLETAGFEAAIIDLRSVKHAMLAVVPGELPVTPEMTTIEANGRRYVVVEATQPWAIGDVTGNTSWENGRAQAAVIPVEVSPP